MENIKAHHTRHYRNVELTVTSVIENACTVETITFAVNDEVFTVRGAYGNAQREAESIITRNLSAREACNEAA